MSSQPKMHHCLKVPELFSAICNSSENNELLQLIRAEINGVESSSTPAG